MCDLNYDAKAKVYMQNFYTQVAHVPGVVHWLKFPQNVARVAALNQGMS